MMNRVSGNCNCGSICSQQYREMYNTSTVGNIAVYVAPPNFSEMYFTPTITMDNTQYEIPWGESMLFNDLVLERYYTVGASEVKIGNKIFTPTLSSSWVQAKKSNYEVVMIEYVESEVGAQVVYSMTYEEMERNENKATLNLRIQNTGNDSIRNWNLKFNFCGNEQIVSVVNGQAKQSGNTVMITSDQLGATIEPNNEASIMIVVTTSSQNIQMENFLLNGMAPQNNMGTVMIYVENPMFFKGLFIPEVSVNGCSYEEVMWGTAEQFDGIPIGGNAVIEAREFQCDNMMYYPVIDEELVPMNSTVPKKVNIRYYAQQMNQNIQYFVDYDLSEYSTGFVCTVTLRNLQPETIDGWTFKFDFLNEQRITQFWSSEITQDGKSVTVKPASWNGRIVGNSSISFGFQAENPASVNYPTNPTLNGARPNPRFTDLQIDLVRPAFPSSMYTPTIKVDDQVVNIQWGETKTIQVLAQSVHRIQASKEVGEERAFISNFTDVNVYSLPTQPMSIRIEYYEAFNNPNVFSGYFATWADFGAAVAADTQIATVAPYVTYMPLAFGKPYMEYTGSQYDMDNIHIVTGLEFGYTAQMIKDGIALLKESSPYVKILLSLGGETYNNWEQLDPSSIARFVQDFGLDGVDIDYEENIGGANCKPNDQGIVTCTTDDTIIGIIRALRTALPQSMGYIISFSAWSVGAYGEGQWLDAPPAHLTTTGVMLTPLREAGGDMDLMNIMAYNAVVVGQPPYNPEQAGEAYKNYFPMGISAIGAHVPPDPQGTEYWTTSQTATVARFARDSKIGGMMLWYLQRQGEVQGSSNVDLAEAIRENLGFPEYPGPLYKGADQNN